MKLRIRIPFWLMKFLFRDYYAPIEKDLMSRALVTGSARYSRSFMGGIIEHEVIAETVEREP